MFIGRLTWRRLRVLIRGLPPDSALFREMNGPWGTDTHLLAGVHDLLASANWQRLALATPKGKPKPRQPKPIPRPGEQRVHSRITPKAMRDFRERHRHRLRPAPKGR